MTATTATSSSILAIWISSWHHHLLPYPLNRFISWILWEDVQHADAYLFTLCVALTALMFVQLRAFARPKAVPLKRLPKRPILSILFKPDDMTTTTMPPTRTTADGPKLNNDDDDDDDDDELPPQKKQQQDHRRRFDRSPWSIFRRRQRQRQRRKQQQQKQQQRRNGRQPASKNGLVFDQNDDDNNDLDGFTMDLNLSRDDDDDDHDDGDEGHDDDDDSGPEDDRPRSKAGMADDGTFFRGTTADLPDSFAPLLSSSQVEMLFHQLTADLLHAIQVEAGVRMRPGRHEIPLDKDRSRPQLVLDVPVGGCRLSALGLVGSDGFSTAQDFNVHMATTLRSKPMVKQAEVVLDPPLPLWNVAPTLIHFPALFQDQSTVPLLRQIQIVRLVMDFIISISSLLEKCLWILESKCQIHLGKVRIMPIYKGHRPTASTRPSLPSPPSATTAATSASRNNSAFAAAAKTPSRRANENRTPPSLTTESPEWRLQLAFSGHVLLFGWIPIPFISVVLPTFVIPQPHSLLEYLLTAEPLASAKLVHENIAEQRIALALLETAETYRIQVQVIATPPAVGIDVTLPGGVALAMEMGLGQDPYAGRVRNGGDAPMMAAGISTSTHPPLAHPFASSSPAPPPPSGVPAVSSSSAGPHQQQQHHHHQHAHRPDSGSSVHSMSSWSTQFEQAGVGNTIPNSNTNNMNSSSRRIHSHRGTATAGSLGGVGGGGGTTSKNTVGSVDSSPFDANLSVPWCLDLAAKGSISHDKVTLHLLNLSATHEESASRFGTRGRLAVWKYRSSDSHRVAPSNNSRNRNSSSTALGDDGDGDNDGPGTHTAAASRPTQLTRRPVSSFASTKFKSSGFDHFVLDSEESPSVAAVLMFPDETTAFDKALRMLQYDYVFEVFDDTRVDAITVSVGATHPMLNGGTMVTMILDSIYAYGSVSAREDAILDPQERKRKRNILRHLPAIQFSFGIQNIFIPPESSSYSDDGQTLFLPALEGGRMLIRLIGGMVDEASAVASSSASAVAAMDDASTASSTKSPSYLDDPPITQGIKLVADFEAASLVIQSEGAVKEFPELEIFEGVKLRTLLSARTGGSIVAHLRPQSFASVTAPSSGVAVAAAAAGTTTMAGPNVFNPLEAYEIDFSGSSVSLKMKEYAISLGHRRVIFPTESSFFVKVLESVVDMGFEGKTQCELSWDFQGLSPILQVTSLGQSPEDAVPENKEQVSLLVTPLRQGRFTFHVSPVGGINITKAATSREHKEGLYDWKFFNALVSPDDGSFKRIIDVLHDKRTMQKLLQVSKLMNEDLHRILQYILKQVWRAKEIFDQEGISDPADIIPMHKMSRIIALFLTGDANQVDKILPIVDRVIKGDGMDVVKVKELLREHLENYDDWASEIDRGVRWAAVAFGPIAVTQPYVEDQVLPLAELEHHAAKFHGIPSASELYEGLLDKPHMPLGAEFSNLVSRVAPYLSFRQIEYILQVRSTSDWQAQDLRRIRYVYSIKRKVLEIAESYGGLSFLPQSFLVSVFLGEATRASLRASNIRFRSKVRALQSVVKATNAFSRPRRLSGGSRIASTASKRRSGSMSTLSRLRQRPVGPLHSPLHNLTEEDDEDDNLAQTPAERVASFADLVKASTVPTSVLIQKEIPNQGATPGYEMADCLLGPQDVAILLQAGLTSVMKGSTVVQLNQRMLLDLICSQPKSFAVAVLAEIGNPSGQGSPRSLTSALMSLLELDQTAFTSKHKIDMHILLESWLPGLKIPRREDYMAGGRWARQSYYEAIYAVANSILEDAETYMALKGHLQRVQRHYEKDPTPQPQYDPTQSLDTANAASGDNEGSSKLKITIDAAIVKIKLADEAGHRILQKLIDDEEAVKRGKEYDRAVSLYKEAFEACRLARSLDKHCFYSDWFRSFYKRNYDSLMIKSIFDNIAENIDNVRFWMHALRMGSKQKALNQGGTENLAVGWWQGGRHIKDNIFVEPDGCREQDIIDAILDAIIYEPAERSRLRDDPLVRLLISNPPGEYNFAVVTAMGVITDGKKGLELQDTFARLGEQRGVKLIRADTGIARSFEYNANKIEEAINTAMEMKVPFGLLGYSQGCANALMAESMLLTGSPKQQEALTKYGGLVCRQLLFSAANGSLHGHVMEKKVGRLFVLCEEFFKYQQGYFSSALSSTVLDMLNNMLDSAHFHKFMGGAQSFVPDGCRAFWREAQHLSYIPTCTLRGVMEDHTTPECLEMISHLLTKQSGSPLHDSQVHVFDAVGYPVYYLNRNGRLLKKCAIGEGTIQRTHHWSPLSNEVEFVRTAKDREMSSFDCAKDRHVFPWIDVNVRFGFIKYKHLPGTEGWEDQHSGSASDPNGSKMAAKSRDLHPSKLVHGQKTGDAPETKHNNPIFEIFGFRIG